MAREATKPGHSITQVNPYPNRFQRRKNAQKINRQSWNMANRNHLEDNYQTQQVRAGIRRAQIHGHKQAKAARREARREVSELPAKG